VPSLLLRFSYAQSLINLEDHGDFAFLKDNSVRFFNYHNFLHINMIHKINIKYVKKACHYCIIE